MIINGRIVTMVMALLVTAFAATCVYAQATAFTYQGRLTDGGIAANGPYDMEFKLFDTAEAGDQVGSTLQLADVPVASGSFAVELDFGEAFPGAARYLEIRISPQGQNNYTTLSPRQRIGSTPYSVKSLQADTAETAGNSEQLGGISASQYVQTNDGRLSDSRTPLSGSNSYVQNTVNPQKGVNFNVSGNGTVGGTMTATTVKLGNSAQYFAPGGEEELRIVRGVINPDGTIAAGTGFTVTTYAGLSFVYTVAFTTAFSSAPSIVATGKLPGIVTNDTRTVTIENIQAASNAISFDINSRNSSGAPAASVIHFIAIGPR